MSNAFKKAKTYITVEEAALRSNRSERTIRRWIEEEKVEVLRNKKFRSVRVDQDDLDRYCAGKPDTSHPVRGEIAKLATNDQTLEQRINLLIQEVTRLQQRVEVLESQDPGGESSHHKASSPRVSGGAESRGLPAGTMRLVPFAEQHGVPVGQIRSLYNQRILDLIAYQRPGEAKRNKQEWWISPEQHQQLVRYWQEHHISYEPCPQCDEQAQNEIG